MQKNDAADDKLGVALRLAVLELVNLVSTADKLRRAHYTRRPAIKQRVRADIDKLIVALANARPQEDGHG